MIRGALIPGAVEKSRPKSRAELSREVRVAISIALVTAAAASGAFLAWFVGLDWWWAVATVVAVGAVGMVFATLKFEEQTPWEPPGRETPRGVRLAIPMMEEALAACDRLARPPITRPIRVLLTNEREDRMARGTLVRQMRALLLAELRAHGVAPAHQTDDAIIALLGPAALTVLQPNDDNPVTSVAIASCLDAVERLNTDPIPSQ